MNTPTEESTSDKNGPRKIQIHGQDSKGKGKGSNEDSQEEAKSNDEFPKEWKASKDHTLV